MRYLITAEYYIYTDSDAEAIEIAKGTAKENQLNYDNQYSVEKVHKVPFGSRIIKQIFPKDK